MDSRPPAGAWVGLYRLCSWMMRSRLEPVKEPARLIRRHFAGVVAYFEHPYANAILEGVRGVRPDLTDVEEITTWRGDAVRRGVELCGPDDTVIVTGKGHEPFLEMAGEFIRYNDAPVMAEAVEKKWGRA